MQQIRPKYHTIYFYKYGLWYAISGGGSYTIPDIKTYLAISKVLDPLIGKTVNVKLEQGRYNVFVRKVMAFCKIEGINHDLYMSWEVLLEDGILKIVINEGKNEEVVTVSV